MDGGAEGEGVQAATQDSSVVDTVAGSDAVATGQPARSVRFETDPPRGKKKAAVVSVQPAATVAAAAAAAAAARIVAGAQQQQQQQQSRGGGGGGGGGSQGASGGGGGPALTGGLALLFRPRMADNPLAALNPRSAGGM
ncbi:MAG: hypothetical protein WDW36_005677 [Sanguina aurantia]